MTAFSSWLLLLNYVFNWDVLYTPWDALILNTPFNPFWRLLVRMENFSITPENSHMPLPSQYCPLSPLPRISLWRQEHPYHYLVLKSRINPKKKKQGSFVMTCVLNCLCSQLYLPSYLSSQISCFIVHSWNHFFFLREIKLLFSHLGFEIFICSRGSF